MYNLEKKYNGFTLVEIIVSITIFSIIMISIMMIFTSVTQTSAKIDISRAMQENTKIIVESISRDITRYGITGVSRESGLGDCNFDKTDGLYRLGDKLCLGGGTDSYEYFLAKETITGTWLRIEYSDIDSKCSNMIDECVLVRKDSTGITRISNSLVYFKDLSFSVSNESIPKVTLNFIIRPSFKKGINSKLIENTDIHFQTTFSQRLIKTN